MGQRVNPRRLVVPGNNDPRAAMLLQIADQGVDPWRALGIGCGMAGKTEFGCDGSGKVRDLTGTKRQAVIRHGTGNRRRRLDGVEPVHTDLALTHSPLGGKVASITDVCRTAEKKISVQRENHLGVFKSVNRIDVCAETQTGAGTNVIAIYWFVLVPLAAGKSSQQLAQLIGKRRRSDRFRQNSQPTTANHALRFKIVVDRGKKRTPGA